MTVFRRLAFWSTLGTYIVIFAGGLVRVSGAGLGCPDWPRCFGGWFPPLSVSQIPPEIDAAHFNFALAWIEYINRLAGMLLGLLIAATAVMAIVQYRKVTRILWPSLLAALFVAFQGWQGGQVVLSELNPLLVSTHLVIALVIVSLLTYVTQQAYFLEEGSKEFRRSYPESLGRWIVVLWVLTILQIMIGAGIRGEIETLIESRPLATDHELLAMIGGIKFVHVLIGVALAVLTLGIGYRIYSAVKQPEPLVRYTLWWLIILVAVQMSLGTGLIAVALPPLLQLFHVWAASLFVGTILVLYTSVVRK